MRSSTWEPSRRRRKKTREMETIIRSEGVGRRSGTDLVKVGLGPGEKRSNKMVNNLRRMQTQSGLDSRNIRNKVGRTLRPL